MLQVAFGLPGKLSSRSEVGIVAGEDGECPLLQKSRRTCSERAEHITVESRQMPRRCPTVDAKILHDQYVPYYRSSQEFGMYKVMQGLYQHKYEGLCNGHL